MTFLAKAHKYWISEWLKHEWLTEMVTIYTQKYLFKFCCPLAHMTDCACVFFNASFNFNPFHQVLTPSSDIKGGGEGQED